MAISRMSSAAICTVVGVSCSWLPRRGRSSPAICLVVAINAWHPRRVVLLESLHYRRIKHPSGFHAELKAIYRVYLGRAYRGPNGDCVDIRGKTTTVWPATSRLVPPVGPSR